jgi:hypothetical protein
MPNISTTFFNSTIETSNSFLALDDEEGIQDSICKPSHQFSPIHRQTFKSALLQAPHGYFGGPGLGSGAYNKCRCKEYSRI